MPWVMPRHFGQRGTYPARRNDHAGLGFAGAKVRMRNVGRKPATGGNGECEMESTYLKEQQLAELAKLKPRVENITSNDSRKAIETRRARQKGLL